jgi:hypothetical protein
MEKHSCKDLIFNTRESLNLDRQSSVSFAASHTRQCSMARRETASTMMLALHATRGLSHKKQDILVLTMALWLSNVMPRLGPIRKRRRCRLTLSPPSHDIINTFVKPDSGWHELVHSIYMPKEDSGSDSPKINSPTSSDHQ